MPDQPSSVFFPSSKGAPEAWDHRPIFERAVPWAVTGAGLGWLSSAFFNQFEVHNAGWKGVFTRTGWHIGAGALFLGTYAFVDDVAANMRQKDDHVNKFAGGCAAGFLTGLRNHSIPQAVGGCAFFGAAAGVYKATGSKLRSDWIYQSREEQEKRRLLFLNTTPAQSVSEE